MIHISEIADIYPRCLLCVYLWNVPSHYPDDKVTHLDIRNTWWIAQTVLKKQFILMLWLNINLEYISLPIVQRILFLQHKMLNFYLNDKNDSTNDLEE